MAKERMITRTVDITTVEVMCLNVKTAEVEIKTFITTGIYENDEKLLKQLKSKHETEEFKLVNISSKETQEKLFAISENDFINIAKEIEKR